MKENIKIRKYILLEVFLVYLLKKLLSLKLKAPILLERSRLQCRMSLNRAIFIYTELELEMSSQKILFSLLFMS